ncbi:MAG TPA: NAD(P)-binding domain-containing protein [Thermoanaerobaculia bacterium]|nr:NAD(P)-binding domain-containing protein [Thermoanaerobaculia bacterium]
MDHGVDRGAVDFEYLILGGGPAGLQLGHHLSTAGHSYLILEAGDGPGNSFKQFPRHRTLISSNKVYTGYDDPEINLRWDWNSLLFDDGKLLFGDYSRKYFPPADKLVQYLGDYAECFNLNIRCKTRIERIERLGEGRAEDGFRLTDREGNAFTCRRLIVATGFSRPYLPEIPGVELAECYFDVSVDPEDFINQRVLIVGKGNSAFETADNLIETTAMIHVCSPSPLKMAWATHFVGHLRAVNNNFLDTYQLKSQNAVLDATIERISRNEEGKLVVSLSYTHACGETEEIVYDRVIFCTGFRFDASIFDESCRPELTINDRFPAQTSEWESVNVPGVYFAGTLTQMRDFKKTTSGFIHGFRYNVRALFRMLDKKYHGRELPSRAVEATPEGLMLAAMERINRSSALWQQYGFLHDVIVLSSDGGTARYYEELPLSYVHDSSLSASDHYYTIALEFGHIHGDPFAIERKPMIDAADESVFLHPVIRRWNGPLLVAEYHLLENLFGEWKDLEHHIEPLRDFFALHLGPRVGVRV